jgi:hypothetical protein
LAIICVPTSTSSSRAAKRAARRRSRRAARRVAVDRAIARAGQHRLHLGLDALGADAAIVEELAAAGRARGGSGRRSRSSGRRPRRAARCTVSVMLQCGHSSEAAQARQKYAAA